MFSCWTDDSEAAAALEAGSRAEFAVKGGPAR